MPQCNRDHQTRRTPIDHFLEGITLSFQVRRVVQFTSRMQNVEGALLEQIQVLPHSRIDKLPVNRLHIIQHRLSPPGSHGTDRKSRCPSNQLRPPDPGDHLGPPRWPQLRWQQLRVPGQPAEKEAVSEVCQRFRNFHPMPPFELSGKSPRCGDLPTFALFRDREQTKQGFSQHCFHILRTLEVPLRITCLAFIELRALRWFSLTHIEIVFSITRRHRPSPSSQWWLVPQCVLQKSDHRSRAQLCRRSFSASGGWRHRPKMDQTQSGVPCGQYFRPPLT